MAHCVWVSVRAHEGAERSRRASGWLQYQQGPDGGRKINRGCVWDGAGEAGEAGERGGTGDAGCSEGAGTGRAGAGDSGGKGGERGAPRLAEADLSPPYPSLSPPGERAGGIQTSKLPFSLAPGMADGGSRDANIPGGSVKVRGASRARFLQELNNETVTVWPPSRQTQVAQQTQGVLTGSDTALPDRPQVGVLVPFLAGSKTRLQPPAHSHRDGCEADTNAGISPGLSRWSQRKPRVASGTGRRRTCDWELQVTLRHLLHLQKLCRRGGSLCVHLRVYFGGGNLKSRQSIPAWACLHSSFPHPRAGESIRHQAGS